MLGQVRHLPLCPLNRPMYVYHCGRLSSLALSISASLFLVALESPNRAGTESSVDVLQLHQTGRLNGVAPHLCFSRDAAFSPALLNRLLVSPKIYGLETWRRPLQYTACAVIDFKR